MHRAAECRSGAALLLALHPLQLQRAPRVYFLYSERADEALSCTCRADHAQRKRVNANRTGAHSACRRQSRYSHLALKAAPQTSAAPPAPPSLAAPPAPCAAIFHSERPGGFSGSGAWCVNQTDPCDGYTQLPTPMSQCTGCRMTHYCSKQACQNPPAADPHPLGLWLQQYVGQKTINRLCQVPMYDAPASVCCLPPCCLLALPMENVPLPLVSVWHAWPAGAITGWRRRRERICSRTRWRSTRESNRRSTRPQWMRPPSTWNGCAHARAAAATVPQRCIVEPTHTRAFARASLTNRHPPSIAGHGDSLRQPRRGSGCRMSRGH